MLWMGADAEVEGEINADGDMARKDGDKEKKNTYPGERGSKDECMCLPQQVLNSLCANNVPTSAL